MLRGLRKVMGLIGLLMAHYGVLQEILSGLLSPLSIQVGGPRRRPFPYHHRGRISFWVALLGLRSATFKEEGPCSITVVLFVPK